LLKTPKGKKSRAELITAWLKPVLRWNGGKSQRSGRGVDKTSVQQDINQVVISKPRQANAGTEKLMRQQAKSDPEQGSSEGINVTR